MAQSVALTEEPEVPGSILGPAHAFVEIDHEIFSMVIFLLALNKEGQLSVWAFNTGDRLGSLSLSRNSAVRLNGRFDITIAAHRGEREKQREREREREGLCFFIIRTDKISLTFCPAAILFKCSLFRNCT